MEKRIIKETERDYDIGKKQRLCTIEGDKKRTTGSDVEKKERSQERKVRIRKGKR